jgi:hypothetical protein
VGGKVLKPQTTIQILRCFNLGGYEVSVDDGELEVRGPQPPAGPLPASIKASRDGLISFLTEWADGVWPPGPSSGLREVEEFLECSLSTALDIVEEARHAA